MSNPAPARGDIVIIDMNPQAGREIGKRRPVLVISRREFNVLGFCIICPITTIVRNNPFEVRLPDTIGTHGIALTNQVKSLDWRKRNLKFLEEMPDAVTEDVIAKVVAIIQGNLQE